MLYRGTLKPGGKQEKHDRNGTRIATDCDQLSVGGDTLQDSKLLLFHRLTSLPSPPPTHQTPALVPVGSHTLLGARFGLPRARQWPCSFMLLAHWLIARFALLSPEWKQKNGMENPRSRSLAPRVTKRVNCIGSPTLPAVRCAP